MPKKKKRVCEKMTADFTFQSRYTINDLIRIVRILRAPGGCPWDREQTHETLKKDLIEETYEVIEAINKKSPAMLREELGDVLLQVVFHAGIETDAGNFDFDDVCDEICKKLILRHPHVFGETAVSSTEEVLANWEAIKMESKRQKSVSESMESVPRELPALMRAQKIQKKAAKAGFDWENVSGALEKIGEETAEATAAMRESADRAEEELGDLLFAVVNVCRFAQVDAEEALTRATDKFAARFAGVEALAAERNVDMKTASIETLDVLWEEVKKRDNS